MCLESSHDLVAYPFVFYSANMLPLVPGAATHAEIVDGRSADLKDLPPGSQQATRTGKSVSEKKL